MKIEIWGTLPPPIGGVTIHLKRLFNCISSMGDVYFVDFGKIKKDAITNVRKSDIYLFEIYRLLFCEKKIIHLHSFSLLLALCFLLVGGKHIYGITIHNQRGIQVRSKLKKYIYSLFLNRCSFIIMNDENYKNKFSSYYCIRHNNIYILPAFIAPLISERKGLPSEVMRFRANHDFVISGNAFQLKKENGIDTYGLDMLIELVNELRLDGIDAGLVFCLPIIGDTDYFSEIQARISDYNLKDHMLIINENICNAFEYWEISDLFIRPTSTDMEGISVKEALYVGTNVVASDVCIRPKECILFENRNQNDLNKKVKDVFISEIYKKRVLYSSMIDTPKEIIKLYQGLDK